MTEERTLLVLLYTKYAVCGLRGRKKKGKWYNTTVSFLNFLNIESGTFFINLAFFINRYIFDFFFSMFLRIGLPNLSCKVLRLAKSKWKVKSLY